MTLRPIPGEITKTHLYCLPKLSRRTRTIIWIWRESGFKERDDRRRDAALRELSDGQRSAFCQIAQILGRSVGKRNFSGQAIPKGSAQRVNIRTSVDLADLDLLRAGKRRRSKETRRRLFRLVTKLGQAKVDHFHPCFAGVRQHSLCGSFFPFPRRA